MLGVGGNIRRWLYSRRRNCTSWVVVDVLAGSSQRVGGFGLAPLSLACGCVVVVVVLDSVGSPRAQMLETLVGIHWMNL